MVRVMHQSLNDWVLSLWRKGAAKSAIECCFFMTTPPFTRSRQVGFIESNHPAYSLGIAPTNSHPLSNTKKFLYLKNLRSDDEAVTTVDDYLTDLNSEFFCKGLQSLHDRWQRVVAARRSVHSINAIIIFSQFNSI